MNIIEMPTSGFEVVYQTYLDAQIMHLKQYKLQKNTLLQLSPLVISQKNSNFSLILLI